MRRGRTAIAAFLVLALLVGVGGAQPVPGVSGGFDVNLSQAREWLRDAFGLPEEVAPEVPLPPSAELALPRAETAPVGEPAPPPERVGERSELREANASFYELSDGRVQAEVSAAPVHYLAPDGEWREIDVSVVDSDRDGVAYENLTNSFRSSFGDTTDQLARFELAEHSITVGLPGPAQPVEVTADGATVTFPEALGSGADVRYQVTSSSLKEEIVLAEPSAQSRFTFTLQLDGLRAAERPDGSIGFYEHDTDTEPLLVMPAPFMFDSGDDPESPYGAPWSPAVSQSLYGEGEQLTVVVSADADWLADPAREYPVVIDPTIAIQPTPTQAQDAMILSDDPDSNFDGNWRLSAGTTTTGSARSVLRFPLIGVPDGVQLDTAALELYYDQTHTTAGVDVPLEARRVTEPWEQSTVTWDNIAEHAGERGASVEMVDDSEPAKTAVVGEWPASTNPLTEHAIHETYRFNNSGPAGQTFTWVPDLPEDGEYEVQAHYVPAFDRATEAPYTVHHAGGQSTVTVNQQLGEGGEWASLGSYEFQAGTSHRVVLGNVPGEAVIADAVRFIKDGTVVKAAGQSSVWHAYDVRNIAQDWIDGTQPNHGLMVQAVDEAHLGKGGPRYSAAEFAYGGESRHTPKLVLTWGKPSVELAPPRTIHATGAELEWSDYKGDDLVEYQVHRTVFQTFTPSAATLVAPVSPASNSFVDTTATPTPVDDPDPFGQVYYYMIVARTTSGELIPSPTQIVRLPRAGRTVEVLRGDAADTTLASGQPDTNHDALAGNPWLMAGNNSETFGTSRAVLDFGDLTDRVPAGARVLEARFGLWSATTVGSGASYEAHPLTTGFDEQQATWQQAVDGVPWGSPGGDFGPAVDTVPEITNDPSWHRWDVDQVVQGWVDDPASNHGMLVKLADESGPAERTLFLSSEAAEPQLRPGIVVTYTAETPELTYHAPTTPASRMIPGDLHTVPVTVSNPTTGSWPADEWELSYRWELPDGTDVTTGGNQLSTPLPSDVAPGEAVDVAAQLRTPIQSEAGNKRTSYVLRWELRNQVTGQWLSAVDGIGPLDQNVVVEDPTSNELGHEHFYQYAGVELGGGQSAMVNTHSGNLTVAYGPFANPGQGVATHARMTYNSRDTSASSMGYGWSLAGSTITRLGSPLELHPPGQEWPTEVTMIDGTGTSHTFSLNTHGSDNPADWDYDKPAGVHLHLTRNPAGDESQAWVMTKPDRTQFFFDEQGYPMAVVDNNGNTQAFTYEERRSRNQPTKFLRYVTDPTGRQSLTLEYYERGDDYTYIDDDGNRVADTNLTNPHIVDQVRAITDIDGRRVELFYTDKGLMAELVDGAGTDLAKTFQYTYDMLQGNNNVKLVAVTDPRGNITDLSYYSPPGEPQFHWWAESITDRAGAVSSFAYEDPDGPGGSVMHTTVTDAEGNATFYATDGFGRPTSVTDALGETTTLTWDADNNVIELEEANGAVTSWTYDPLTGYPLTIRDPEANANGTAATSLTYQTGLGGHIADLVARTSAEGRTWNFAYDQVGNLTEVIDPLGVAGGVPGEFTTRYVYDDAGRLIRETDANGNQTFFTNYHPTGFPETIVDALGGTVETVYDARGNVLAVTDEVGATTTVEYDLYSRPLDMVTPLDEAAGRFITTPAPIYDPNDNVVIEPAPNGAVTTYQYDSADRPVAVESPKDDPADPDRVTTFDYDPLGNVLSTTEPLGNLPGAEPGSFTTSYEYDEVSQVVTETDAEGNQTSYSYDEVGLLTEITDPRGHSTSYRYDLNGQVVEVIDAAGHTAGTEYDLDGLPVASIDQEGVRTETDYDERGMVVETRAPHREGVTRVSRYEYDEAGNTVRVISPRGVASGDPEAFAQETVYDELHRPVEQILPYDPNDPVHHTPDRILYEYDAAGRATLVSAPPSDGQSVRNDTVTEYFDTGWVRRSTDPWDIVTEYDYNVLGQQTGRTLISAGGVADRTMTWDHFPDGKLAARTDDGVPAGLHVVLVDNSDLQHITSEGDWDLRDEGDGFVGFDYATHAGGDDEATFEWGLTIPADGRYEAFARWPQVSGAATDAEFTIAHGDGESIVEVDQSADPAEWTALGSFELSEGIESAISVSGDADGTVIADAVMLVRDNSAEAGDSLHKDISYRYDANGNQVEIVDNSTGAAVDSYAFAYDGLNRMTVVEEILGGQVEHTTSYTYDPNGNLLTRDHDRQQASFVYDERNLVTEAVVAEPGVDPKVTTLAYTARGQQQTLTHRNGNTVAFTYYPDGTVQTQTETGPAGQPVASYEVEYDLSGNPSQVSTALQDADDPTAQLENVYSYRYDPRERLVEARRTPAGGEPVAESYVHDANDNVVSATIDGETTISTYDRNRLQSTTAGEATSSYNYDPFGRLDTVTADGEIAQRYVYDGFDRTVEQHAIAGDETSVTLYEHDPFDRTVSRTDDAGTADAETIDYAYLGTGGQVISEHLDGALHRTYQYGPGGLRLSMHAFTEAEVPEEASYYSYSPRGDVAAITDEAGNTRATYGYTAYGSPELDLFTGVDAPDESDPDRRPYNVYRFNAMAVDPGSGNYDMGFRDYAPDLNRFLTRDMYNGGLADLGMATSPWTQNRYAFGAGNPISRVEVDGHCWENAWGWVQSACDTVSGWIDSGTQAVTGAVSDAVDFARDSWDTVTDVASDVVDTVTDAAADAWEATTDFVEEYKAEIVGIAVGVGVTAGCLAITAGAGSIGCAALGGAIGAGVTGYMNGQRGWDLVGTMAVGAAFGAIGGAAGAAIGRGLATATSRLGNVAGRGATQAGRAVERVGDFASNQAAFRHYAKHAKGVVLGSRGSATAKPGGADMPEFGSFGSYRAAARQFMGGGKPPGAVEGIRRGGDLLRVDPKSGYFGIRSPGGVIRTFFRPDGDPLSYFRSQF